MKTLSTALSLTTLLGLSLSLAPAAQATEAATTSTSPIAAYWAQNQQTLGAPLSPEETFANGSSQQAFEKGVLTYGKYGGVQAILGQAGETFLKAGGAEKFGNAESAAWKHSYCGLSISTHSGSSRWLVVLDSSTQAGSFIKLSSPEAKQWIQERKSTGSCFSNNSTLETTPALPESHTKALAAIQTARQQAQAQGVSFSGQAAALTQVSQDLISQDLGNNLSALYSISQDKALIINSNALASYLLKPDYYGSYLYQNEYISNSRTGQLEVRALFYNSSAQNCSTPQGWDDHGYALYSAPQANGVIGQYFVQYDDYGTCINWENQTAAAPVAWAPGLLDRTPQGQTIDSSYDWSKATYLEIQQVLELPLGNGKAVYIKADPSGKPLAGAQPVESDLLLASLEYADRGRFSLYNEWANGGAWNIWTNPTMLGAPIAPSVEGTSAEGEAIMTQEFEGGTMTWFVGTEHGFATLNDLGQKKLAWYNSLGL